MLHTIQVKTPICPECGGGMKFNKITNLYLCQHCGQRYKVTDIGKTEREFICEKVDKKAL